MSKKSCIFNKNKKIMKKLNWNIVSLILGILVRLFVLILMVYILWNGMDLSMQIGDSTSIEITTNALKDIL